MDTALWKIIWAQKTVHISLFAALIAAVVVVFLLKNRLSKKPAVFNIIRYGILTASFFYVGLYLKAQPTTTNIGIAISSAKDGNFPLELFLMEPFIFLSFAFIIVSSIIWGRGAYCGWLCPYGAMLELLNAVIGKRVNLKVPQGVHKVLLKLKYAALAAIVGVAWYNFMLSEYLTEVEPFKTFVLKLNRQWYFVAYFFVLTILSLIVYRAFCRYLCPLGAAISVPAVLKKILPISRLKRRALCVSCKVCAKSCASAAISSTGVINYAECMHCFDCQMIYHDTHRCTELIGKKR
ncbi:4Fe-4S binding protein [Candidatus Magnetomonas plexicatena]|uniref:4Fe-4S binding protein n=1 Tax=Candidatus Magnetomonas plexicatena TaxID=2552947 RepID=UPI001C744425|nr:4Fe-4S binding protein [Nitrospirales bacterium LBB_01]